MKFRDLTPYRIEEYGQIGGNGRLIAIDGYDVFLDGHKVCQIPVQLLEQSREEILREIERLSQEKT